MVTAASVIPLVYNTPRARSNRQRLERRSDAVSREVGLNDGADGRASNARRQRADAVEPANSDTATA